MNSSVDHGIVWARRSSNEIYWPGKILVKPMDNSSTWSFQTSNYYQIQFFVTQQLIWTDDLFPYGQYRDSMTNNSFVQYGLHPTIKQDFVNAVHQADYEINQIMINNSSGNFLLEKNDEIIPIIDDKTDNDFLSMPTPIFPSETGDPNISILSTFDPLPIDSNNNSNGTSMMLTTDNDWYSQQNLFFESITPPLPIDNELQPVYASPMAKFEQTTAMIIVSTRNSSSSSFLSFLFNCLTPFPHRSIHYIDEPINESFPSTISTIIYLFCFDHDDPTLQQTLDRTILNNLNVHRNYFFLLFNSPSQTLINHLYETVMDKRLILILHYHSSPSLLCSGDRQTFEYLQEFLLKYLSSKVKYIDGPSPKDQQFYSASCIASMIQTSNVLHRFVHQQIQQTINERFHQDMQQKNRDLFEELFPSLPTKDSLLNLIEQEQHEWFDHPDKQSKRMHDLFHNGAIQTRCIPPICEYYLENLLDKH